MEEGETESGILGLYRRLLAINYYETIEPQEYEEPERPLRKVPTNFSSVEEYREVFGPLILEECLALMQRGQVEETEVSIPYRCVTGEANQVDDFLMVGVITDTAPGEAKVFKQNDVILLTKDSPEKEDMKWQINALGIVETLESERALTIRFWLDDSDPNLRPSEKRRIQACLSGLRRPNSGFYITQLCSLSTIIREWNAMHSIVDVKFKNLLLHPSSNPHIENANQLKVPVALGDKLAGMYNKSQMKALTAGLDGQEVVLIQGPPGTGKTRTLLGLLSIILYAAKAGTPGLKRYAPPKTQQLTETERVRLWQKTTPWLTGQPLIREEVKPWEEGSIVDVFGLLNVAKPVLISKKLQPKAHVLVCAPSNSALDEIVIRLLSSGIIDRTGKESSPSIVRVGLSIHHSVQSVSLDALVQQRLARAASAKGRAGPSKVEIERLKMEVIESANIVCSTLSFSGSSLLQRISRPFDVVVIDEAAQAVEPATLIPLCSGAKQVYMIGDPVQLPATVISKRAVSFDYDVSLFKRLQSAGYPVNVLDVQYRMHPKIAYFPSQEFYQGKLKNGPNVLEDTTRAWHAAKCLGPFTFFDVRGEEQVPEGSSSLVNHLECEMVVSLYMTLVQQYPAMRKSASDIAIISPYKAQVNLLKQKFRAAMGEQARKLDINTIDGFQGREKEVAIFSAVRSNYGRGRIGFVADERRINVGLTRARCSMLVIGNAQCLDVDPRWHSLLRHARSTRCLYQAESPFSDYLNQVIEGKATPEGPTAQDLREIASLEIGPEEEASQDAKSSLQEAPASSLPSPVAKASKKTKAKAKAQPTVPSKRARKTKGSS